MNRLPLILLLNLVGLSISPLALGQTPIAPASTAPTPAPAPAPESAPPAPPAEVPAASPEVTVVALDGAVFRGALIEKLPGQYVTVRVATGELRRVAWHFIATIDGQPVNVRPTAFVRFRADHPDAELEEWVSGGDWVSLCRTPCSGNVRQGETLRVGGAKILPSQPFKVPAGRDKMQVDAEAVTRSQRIWGVVLAVGGGGTFLIGSSAFAIGSASNSTVEEENGQRRELTDTERRNFRTAGGVMMGVGAALGITGLVLLLDGTEVRVAEKRRTPGSRPRTASGPRLTARGLVF